MQFPKDIYLRYIDAVEFDPQQEDIFSFLKENMKIQLALPENLFKDIQITKNPSSFNWQVSYSIREPEGMIIMRFTNGLKDERPSLIWETMVHSSEGQIPELPSSFLKWLTDAHRITDDWFFKLIEGKLERRFSGE